MLFWVLVLELFQFRWNQNPALVFMRFSEPKPASHSKAIAAFRAVRKDRFGAW